MDQVIHNRQVIHNIPSFIDNRDRTIQDALGIARDLDLTNTRVLHNTDDDESIIYFFGGSQSNGTWSRWCALHVTDNDLMLSSRHTSLDESAFECRMVVGIESTMREIKHFLER